MPTKAKPAAKAAGGFTVKSFKGMSKKRMASPATKAWGMRLPLKKSTTLPIQFLQSPDDAREFEVHAFQEGGRWNFVPCAGDVCPLCQSPNERQAKTSYRFAINVYNLEAKKVQVLEGGTNLAQVVYYKYERGTANFLKRTFDITMMPTQPASFNLERSDEETVSTKNLTLLDLDAYMIQAMKDYYGDEMPSADALFEDASDEDEEDEGDDDAVDDDDEDEDDDDSDDDSDDEDEDDDEDDEDDDEDDEDDDDEDEDEEDDDDEDDDDDDDEDEDEPPAKSSKASKAPAKKAAAPKKAPARKK